MELRTFKSSDEGELAAMGQVHVKVDAMVALEQMKNIRPHLTTFIRDLEAADRISSGHYSLLQPSIFEELRGLIAQVSAAIDYASRAENIQPGLPGGSV